MLTIVIPARNDADALSRTLVHIEGLEHRDSIEVIVAASGDTERTAATACNRAAVIWPPQSTRAALMNAGAAIATGDILLFLHADSLPPLNAEPLISNALRTTSSWEAHSNTGSPSVIGAFRSSLQSIASAIA